MNPVDLSEAMPASDAEVCPKAGLDERALESMLNQYGGLVKGTLLQRYSTAFGAADLDDVMAIAVERVWRNRQKFDPTKGSLKAWFFRIADNVARDILRIGWFKARKLEVVVEQEVLDVLPTMEKSDREQPMEEGAGQTGDAMRTVLREVLAELPEPQRRILWADALSSSGPVPTVDLARELNLSRGTVRVYRAKALARLRTELADHPVIQQLKDASNAVK